MIEFSLYSEWPKADFHSAVITSFSFNLPYFDSLVLGFLHSKKIVSINLLVDQNMMDMAFESGTGLAYHVGRDYLVNGINSQGAFHPKIYFFIGDDCLMMFAGSGNVTFCGNGKNHEIFSGLYADLKEQKELPLLQETWTYLCRFAESMPEYAHGRIVTEIQANCSLLKNIPQIEHHLDYDIDKGVTASILYNEPHYNLLSQVYDKLGDKNINRITILSPFFDQKGDVISEISELFPNAQIDVLISDKCILPPNEMKQDRRISFYHFEKTERGKLALSSSLNFSRKLHAKIIHFTDGVKEYLLLGSANATTAAFGTDNKQAQNDEFCIMLIASKKNYLKDLGLLPKVKFPSDISMMIRDVDNTSLSNKRNMAKLTKIISADMLKNKLVLKLANINCHSKVLLYGYMMHEGLVKIATCQVEDKIVVSTKNMEELVYCELHDADDNIVSNRLYINHLSKLSLTNPSRKTRSITELLVKLSNGEGGLDEIAEYTLKFFQETVQDYRQKGSVNGSSKKEKIEDLSSIVYDVDFDADDFDNNRMSLRRDSAQNMTDIISYIEKAMRNRAAQIRDDQSDEEEEGDASTSYDRKFSDTRSRNKGIDYRKQLNKSIEDVISVFVNMIHVPLNNQHIIDFNYLISYNLFSVLLINTFCMDLLYGEQEDMNKEELNYTHHQFLKLGHKLAMAFVNCCLKSKLIQVDEEVEIELSNAINRTFLMFALMNQKIETVSDEQYYKPKKDICAYNLLHLYRQYYTWDNQTYFWNDFMSHFSQVIQYDKLNNWIIEIMTMDSSYTWYEGHGVCMNKKFLKDHIKD